MPRKDTQKGTQKDKDKEGQQKETQREKEGLQDDAVSNKDFSLV